MSRSARSSLTANKHTYLDCEGSPLGGDLGGLSVGRGDLAFSARLDSSQRTRLDAVLCYLSQDVDGPHSGGLDDLREHVGGRLVGW